MTMHINCGVCSQELDPFDLKPHKCKTMNKPHKHAELIKAWADGAEIEEFTNQEIWLLSPNPAWNIFKEYRIKPEPKPEPKKITLYIYNNNVDYKSWISSVSPDKIIAGDKYAEYVGSIEVLK